MFHRAFYPFPFLPCLCFVPVLLYSTHPMPSSKLLCSIILPFWCNYAAICLSVCLYLCMSVCLSVCLSRGRHPVLSSSSRTQRTSVSCGECSRWLPPSVSSTPSHSHPSPPTEPTPRPLHSTCRHTHR